MTWNNLGQLAMITSWHIDGEKAETVTDFIFLGSTITVDGDCSHNSKRCLLLGTKAMTNLDSVLKSRDRVQRNESPVYVRYRIQVAWGWCTGMIQRDDMGWEVGGGLRIGNSCTPVADSCQCMAKPIQYC